MIGGVQVVFYLKIWSFTTYPNLLTGKSSSCKLDIIIRDGNTHATHTGQTNINKNTSEEDTIFA